MEALDQARDAAAPNARGAESGEGHGFWATVREAIRGSRHVYTEGPIGRAIVLLAIPMVLEMAMESIFAVADVFYVGRLGADAVATIGLTESVLTLLYAVAMGLSIGGMALVARRIGEKDAHAAAIVAGQAILLGVLIALPVGLFGLLFARQILEAMGASSWVLENGLGYTRIMFACNGCILLLFLINAIFRGAGDAAISMRVLWLANAINLILAPCLIFGLGPFPALGVKGAAAATSCGRGIGVLYQLYRLSRGDGRVTLRLHHLKPRWETMRTMLRLSGSAVIQSLVGMSSWVFLVRIISSFGSAAVAGWTIAMRIVLFALLPSWGMSSAAATMVGQSLGAHKPERAERAAVIAGIYNMLFLGAVGLCFFVLVEPIVGLFSRDPAVLPVAARALRTLAIGFPFYAWGMVFTQSFNGAGDTNTPTLLNVIVFWLFEIPLAWALARPLGYGPPGVFFAAAIAFCLLALLSGVLFKRGQWKLRRV